MKTRPAAILLMVLALALVGCDNDDDPVVVNRSRSFVHIASAADVSSFDVTFDYYNADNTVIEDFFFRRNFPNVGYANLEATDSVDQYGNGKLFLSLSRQPFANVDPDTILMPTELALNGNEQSTIMFVDSIGTMSLLKLADDFSFTDTDTFARVRFINLAAEQDQASLHTSDGSFASSSFSFKQNSEFMSIGSQFQQIEIQDDGGTVVASQQLYFFPRTAYTIYLGGSGAGTLGWFQH